MMFLPPNRYRYLSSFGRFITHTMQVELDHTWCGCDIAMRRYGFGEKTGESDAGNLAQYENGVVEFSEQAAKHATQEYPKESPAGAVALVLAEVGGVSLGEYANPTVDSDSLRDAVEGVDGVGEETANAVLEAVEGAL